MRRIVDALIALCTALGVALIPSAPSAWGQALTLRGIPSQLDVPYASPAGQTLLLDVFMPPGGGTHPGVLLVHGGGFHLGDKGLMRPVGLFLAGHGYVAFSINYRFAPAFPYPAAVQDAEQSIEFMRGHAAQYHMDPRRVGALGGSAGGTIVASLGTMEGRGSSGAQVAAVVSWSGIMDMSHFLQERQPYVGIISAYVYGTASGQTSQDTPQLQAASPITHVTPDDPPMFIANSPSEIMPFDQATEMEGRLRQAGVPVEPFVPTRGHAIQYQSQADQPSLAFLNRYVTGFSGTTGSPSPPSPSASGPGRGSGSPTSQPPARRSNAARDVVVIVLGVIVLAVVILAVLWLARGQRRPRAHGSPPSVRDRSRV